MQRNTQKRPVSYDEYYESYRSMGLTKDAMIEAFYQQKKTDYKSDNYEEWDCAHHWPSTEIDARAFDARQEAYAKEQSENFKTFVEHKQNIANFNLFFLGRSAKERGHSSPLTQLPIDINRRIFNFVKK